MTSDRDVLPAVAGEKPEVAVWLAGAAARARFEAAAQTAGDRERWRQITSARRLEEWEVSRALLAHARNQLGPGVIPSLSHSGGYAAVAASGAAVRVGVDLECARRPRDVMRLARFAFSERELVQLEALPTEARDERFYMLWTLKEAFAKALQLRLLASLARCTFVEEGGEWHGSVPGAAEWIAHAFRPSATLVLSVVAVLPEAATPGSLRISTSEWPRPGAQSWRTLATLRSRRV